MKATLLEKLRNIDRQVEKVPSGWKTSLQLQDEWQCSQAWAARLLQKGIAAGIIEVRRFRIRCSSGWIKRTPHYREKPGKSSGSS